MRHALLLSAICLPMAAHAATLQSFDVPGAEGTCGTAIASTGLVAGITFVPVTVGTTAHAATPVITPFLYAAGHLSYPHANLPAGTAVFTGVNQDRFITAYTFDFSTPTPVTTNFVYHHGTISMPDAGSLPVLGWFGITDKGVLLGQSQVQPSGGIIQPRRIGFLRAPSGKVTVIDDGSSYLTPRAMDARADRVVGSALSGPLMAWVFADGVFTPLSFPGDSFTLPTGVDERGTITGSYILGSATSASTPSHGFFLRHGVYTTYDVPLPGVTSTSIGGMNEAEQITGCYTDAKGTHGFIQTP